MTVCNLPILYQNNILPTLSNGLDGYINYVNSIEVLTKQEEFDLATKLKEDGDLAAAQKLVLSNLRYVIMVAKGYLGYGLGLADLIQEGTVGLMKAVKKFSPNRQVRLVTFAIYWIKAEMHEFILRNWRIVKIATTKAQRKLFFKLRSAKKSLTWFTMQEINKIASDLKVNAKDVMQMESRMTSNDASFDLPLNYDNKGNDSKVSFAPMEYLEDQSISSNSEYLLLQRDYKANIKKLYSSLNKLDSRSKYILENRWLKNDDEGKKITLKNLAKKYKLSKERIRQIEEQAILKVKSYFNNMCCSDEV